MEHAVSLFGSFDENINAIEKQFGVSVISQGSELRVQGGEEETALAERAINALLTMLERGEALSEQTVRYVLSLVSEGNDDKLPANVLGLRVHHFKGQAC